MKPRARTLRRAEARRQAKTAPTRENLRRAYKRILANSPKPLREFLIKRYGEVR